MPTSARRPLGRCAVGSMRASTPTQQVAGLFVGADAHIRPTAFRPLRGRVDEGIDPYDWDCFNFSAWSAVIRASMMGSRSPSMMLSIW